MRASMRKQLTPAPDNAKGAEKADEAAGDGDGSKRKQRHAHDEEVELRVNGERGKRGGWVGG